MIDFLWEDIDQRKFDQINLAHGMYSGRSLVFALWYFLPTSLFTTCFYHPYTALSVGLTYTHSSILYLILPYSRTHVIRYQGWHPIYLQTPYRN
jgi:hypothetical protein